MYCLLAACQALCLMLRIRRGKEDTGSATTEPLGVCFCIQMTHATTAPHGKVQEAKRT